MAEVGTFFAKCIFSSKRIEEEKLLSFFEERIVLVRAGSFDEAFANAEKEGKNYATVDKCTFHECVGVFHTQDPIEDGTEIFSMYRVSDEAASDYIARHYKTGNEWESFLFRSSPGLDPNDT